MAHGRLPDWLRAPEWLMELGRDMRHFIDAHQGAGIFFVIFTEELGIPWPLPGDVAIMLAGYYTTRGTLNYGVAFLSVVVAATLGATCLLAISRALGHRALVRYGRFIGLNPERLARAEASFLRWGPWAIIVGRLIPGMRIILSAFAGAFNIPYRVFVPSVLISSSVWAVIFLELGRRLGPRTRDFFRIIPAHLLPWILLVGGTVVLAGFVYERRFGRHRAVTSAQGTKADQTP
jgi:membrane protein DedA with SNARE-associated domain